MKKTPLLLFALALSLLAVVFSGCGRQQEEEPVEYKPVIYLYPQQPTAATVTLAYDGALTALYPLPEQTAEGVRWQVTALPDGTLIDGAGQTYNYLFWEGARHTDYDFSAGYCVAGADTAAFLEEKLAALGLNRQEANEFIVYWLPRLQANPYNVIAFQSDAYTEGARLTVTPTPDAVIRVFMAWYGSEEPVEIAAPTLSTPQRDGFTVVEWGGCEVK